VEDGNLVQNDNLSRILVLMRHNVNSFIGVLVTKPMQFDSKSRRVCSPSQGE